MNKRKIFITSAKTGNGIKFLLSVVVVFMCGGAGLKAQNASVTNQFGMEFALVKPGSMIVGKFEPAVSPVNFDGKPLPEKMVKKAKELAKKDARPGFKVNIKKAYYLGKFEITQAQWTTVMGSNPSIFQSGNAGNQPVENISWANAQAFVRKLNLIDKKYRYRLPTEFEWEYAARAGAQDDIPWKEIQETAVIGGEHPALIGTKKPNGWGFYDMLGNVWEWVQDLYNRKMFADPVPTQVGTAHVLKGSSFTGDVKNATYMTHAAGPGNGFDIGLRLVLEIR